MYGWAMIIAVTRYKVTGKYTIDSGIFGPTEIRIIISAIMVAEIFVKDIMLYSAVVVSSIFFIVNIFDTVKLLKVASEKDAAEKAGKL
jgi:hypothetical protein